MIKKILQTFYIRYSIDINILFYIYNVVSLGAFIMPENVVSKYKIFYELVKFMETYFPNIKIFSVKSSLPEIVELHMSFMWAIGLVFVLYISIYNFCLYSFFKDTDEFLLERLKSKENIFLTMLLTLGGIFGAYTYYSAYMITNGFSILGRDIIITLNSRFEIFFWIYIFQFMFIASFFFVTMPIPEYILKIIKRSKNHGAK